jgi:hypothetical protein
VTIENLSKFNTIVYNSPNYLIISIFYRTIYLIFIYKKSLIIIRIADIIKSHIRILNKIISTKKISATFLAIVLIAGTIAMISPSFMTSAQAFVMDNNNYKKSFGKDVSVKYVKCNNINVNVNGLEIDINDLPNGFLGADAAETQASGFGSGSGSGGSSNGPPGFDNDGFVFVCINNNNNNNGDADDDDGNGPPSEECTAFVACFNNPEFAEPANQIVTTLERTGELAIKEVPGFPEGYVIGEDVLTPEELCEWLLFTPQSNGQVITTQEQLDPIIDALASPNSIGGFIECLGEAVGFLPTSEP